MNNSMKVALAAVLVLILVIIFVPQNPTPEKIGTQKTTTGSESLCSMNWLPVCWEDGKTYANSCTAETINKVTVAYMGECKETSAPVEPEATGSTMPLVPDTLTGSEADMSPDAQTGSEIEMVPETSTGSLDTGTGQASTGTVIPYYNTAHGYGFNLPKSAYYMAFGAQNGASHSVGVKTGTGVESLAESDVRVYFYANRVLDKLSNGGTGTVTDPATGNVYLLLDGKHSVMIESDKPNSTIVNTIIGSIHTGEK